MLTACGAATFDNDLVVSHFVSKYFKHFLVPAFQCEALLPFFAICESTVNEDSL